jgi:D-serine deaminase-like pyridoxal phosphate-dependent protein
MRMSSRSITEHLTLEPAPRRVADLDTPIPLVEIGVVERNLRRWQERCDQAELGNRPHIKTHKMVGFAKAQLALGARGVTVQKLGEAEAMAQGGIRDMLLTFNVLGDAKLARLSKLVNDTDIKVTADNSTVVAGLGRAAEAGGRTLEVLVECDTGMKRAGVQSPAEAAALARRIASTPGLAYGGLMTYPKPQTRSEAAAFLAAAREEIGRAGLETRIVSTGGTPEMWKDEGLDLATEYRAGTYIFNDRSLVERKLCAPEDCALTVLATVVSRPTPDRALLDAGSKALTSDLLGLTGYGAVSELGQAIVYEVNEEHGYLDLAAAAVKPAIGDRVRVLPNHVCPVVNLFDRVAIVDGEDVLGFVRVDARGAVQ